MNVNDLVKKVGKKERKSDTQRWITSQAKQATAPGPKTPKKYLVCLEGFQFAIIDVRKLANIHI